MDETPRQEHPRESEDAVVFEQSRPSARVPTATGLRGRGDGRTQLTDALSRVLDTEGQRALEDPRRLRAALLDELGDHPSNWRDLIAAVVDTTTVTDLVADSSADSLDGVEAKLQAERGVAEETSAGAVEVWRGTLQERSAATSESSDLPVVEAITTGAAESADSHSEAGEMQPLPTEGGLPLVAGRAADEPPVIDEPASSELSEPTGASAESVEPPEHDRDVVAETGNGPTGDEPDDPAHADISAVASDIAATSAISGDATSDMGGSDRDESDELDPAGDDDGDEAEHQDDDTTPDVVLPLVGAAFGSMGTRAPDITIAEPPVGAGASPLLEEDHELAPVATGAGDSRSTRRRVLLAAAIAAVILLIGGAAVAMSGGDSKGDLATAEDAGDDTATTASTDTTLAPITTTSDIVVTDTVVDAPVVPEPHLPPDTTQGPTTKAKVTAPKPADPTPPPPPSPPPPPPPETPPKPTVSFINNPLYPTQCDTQIAFKASTTGAVSGEWHLVGYDYTEAWTAGTPLILYRSRFPNHWWDSKVTVQLTVWNGPNKTGQSVMWTRSVDVGHGCGY